MSASRSIDGLRRLALAHGILPEFTDLLGVRRVASPDTLRAVLAVLGVDARRATARPPLPARPTASPTRCFTPRRKRAGLAANLYSVRSARDLGAGDFGSLRELVRIAAARGLDFVGVNPLHALRNRRGDESPYLPISRIFRNALYLDPTAAPELAHAPEARAVLASREVARLHRAAVIDYDAVWALRMRILEPLHRAFRTRQPHDGARTEEYRRFVATGGRELEDFAVFQALDEHWGPRDGFGFRRWPARFRDPRGRAVAGFAAARRDRVEFHLWLQFETARQWRDAAALARKSGLALGLYNDLAVGSAPDSADVWMWRDDHVAGFGLGAPPDPSTPAGQAWGLPPLHPGHLTRGGSFFPRLLAAAMDDAGVLRIDHAIGLVRQYWIPDGAPATEGVMVTMPALPLFEAIARESRRRRCVVVAEDLGTVPEALPGLLRSHRMLSSQVMAIARDAAGRFVSPADYPRPSLATVDTHDMIPLAGFVAGADLPLRRRFGWISGASGLRAARAARRDEVDALRRMLARATRQRSLRGAPRSITLVRAAHAALAASPCTLVAYMLDDVALESQPINVPGITSADYPVWSRRMSVPLEELARRSDLMPRRR